MKSVYPAPLSVSSVSSNSSHFSPPSFAITDSGASLVGGTGGYGYAVAYAPNGDLAAANDSVNGNWAYTYDDFNRLVAAACSQHCPDGQNTQAFSYVYDRYANLWQKNVTAGNGPMLSVTFSTGNNNRIDTYSYDASGNLLNDGTHAYTYNAESEIIQVDTGTTATYLYDADGRRVRKTTATATVDYVYDLAGHQIAEINSSGAWTREEVYAGGHHLATYSGGPTGTTYFDHADWLGTERGRSNMAGTICETIVSLPFGDGEVTSGSCGDVSPMHYTGKQRDTETNLDDFDARYYSSEYGRFMSSDWSAVPVPVPYANLTNPQTLNLYAIVNDNVMTFVDLNGHVPLLGQSQLCISAATCNAASGPSCTLDGIAVSCSLVTGLSGAGSVVAMNGIPLTTDQRNGQSDPTKTEQADRTSVVNSFDPVANSWTSVVHVESKAPSFWQRIKSWFSSGSKSEPIPSVTAATDTAGLVGIVAPKVTKELHLGPLSAGASMLNDRSPTNIFTNLLGLVDGFDGPMAITGAFNDFLEYGANNSTPGPKKAYDQTELQLTPPTQDSGCEAGGLPSC